MPRWLLCVVVTAAAASNGDRFLDGTPDFLRLDSVRDRETFTRWFTWLAEMQAYRPRADLPVEISDCAGLIRYAYRESLRAHDARWASEQGLRSAPPAGDLTKYRYPFTPLRASLFRITSGPFSPSDVRKAFAEFADAQTLMRFNTHFISRSLDRARPGDLLFYRQLEQRLPFHAMIYLGRSHFDNDRSPRIIYHTGPIGRRDPGEIRRPTVNELLHHPEPRWRPHAGNPNFLGVYRWNILREDS
jgi:uncharacterized protein YfaT (DUF1175 family)